MLDCVKIPNTPTGLSKHNYCFPERSLGQRQIWFYPSNPYTWIQKFLMMCEGRLLMLLLKEVLQLATINLWFVGCSATRVVCEGPSIWRYLGHTENVVTPQWILKTVKENKLQRLVHLSADLARQAFGILGNFQARQEINGTDGSQYVMSVREHPMYSKSRASLEER